MKKKKKTPVQQLTQPAEVNASQDVRAPNTYKPTSIENKAEYGQSLAPSAATLTQPEQTSASDTLQVQDVQTDRRRERPRTQFRFM